MQQLIRTRKHWSPAVYLGLVDLLFFGLTDPSRVPSSYFIVAFILVAVTIYASAKGFCQLLKWYGMPIKRQQRVALTFGGIASGLLALQSVGQLTTRDLAVLLPLAVLAYFYFSYNPSAKSSA